MAMREAAGATSAASLNGCKAWFEIPERLLSFTRIEPTPRKTILITATDEQRLRALARRHARYPEVMALEAELTRARIVAPQAVPPDVVTMNSRVVYCDQESATVLEVRLVYPSDLRSETDISVLTALGTALLGVSAGEKVTCPAGRRPARLHVRAVVYQPERAGDFHL